MSHDLHRYDYESFLGAAHAARPEYFGDAWCGGLDRSETLHCAAYGDDGNVPRAHDVMDKLQGSIETPRALWRRNVGGCYPVVAEHLQGIPDAMRERRRLRDASHPITVYASIMASCTVSAEDMMKRGIAILALVLKLQAIRPIKLYAVCPWVYSTLLIEIPTRPLSIAHAAFCLSHPAFFRRLGHEVLFSTGDRCTAMADDPSVPARLGMRPTDLYVGTGVSSLDWTGGAKSEYATVLQDPVGWINETIRRYAHL